MVLAYVQILVVFLLAFVTRLAIFAVAVEDVIVKYVETQMDLLIDN